MIEYLLQSCSESETQSKRLLKVWKVL